MNSFRDRARLLRLMAHPMRLEILALLRRSDECVCHMSAYLKKPQPNVSQQLAILREAGLIADHREGTNVFYGLDGGEAAPTLVALLDDLLEGADPAQDQGHRGVAGCVCPKCQAGHDSPAPQTDPGTLP